jgi:hypothetical protein
MRAMNTSLEGERGQAKTGPVLARRITSYHADRQAIAAGAD